MVVPYGSDEYYPITAGHPASWGLVGGQYVTAAVKAREVGSLPHERAVKVVCCREWIYNNCYIDLYLFCWHGFYPSRVILLVEEAFARV